MSYNHLRANIRNAYFCEDTDDILDQINQRLCAGRVEEAGYLRELLNEALDELFDSVKRGARPGCIG